MPELEERKSESLENVRRELQRRSLDLIKLFNPLDRPFEVIFDSFRHAISPKKEDSFPRYIAERWIKKFIDERINEEEQQAIDDENTKRKDRGWEPLNPQEREQFDISHKLTTDNQELRKKWLKVIYKGVSKEYGASLPEKVTKEATDRRPQDIQLMEQLDAEMGFAGMLPDTEEDFEVPDIEEKKEKLMEEIK